MLVQGLVTYNILIGIEIYFNEGSITTSSVLDPDPHESMLF